jgi:hypothetical protein
VKYTLPKGWKVYHSSEAGQQQLHESGWYYEPDDGPIGTIWSECYPTKRAAILACWSEARALEIEKAINSPLTAAASVSAHIAAARTLHPH